MTDFDYEVKERKSIARGAYHKKGGSKSKKCSLPSDRLTAAQKRKLNGPVTTYNLANPMTYAEFKCLPAEYQAEYLNGLNSRFHVGLAPISADLFGLCKSSLWTYCKTTGVMPLLSNSFGNKGAKLDAEEKKVWHQFCGMCEPGEDTCAEIEEAPVPEEEKEETSPAPVRTDYSLSCLPELMCGGEVRMSGLASELLPALVRMIGGNDAQMSVHFRFVRKEEETDFGRTEENLSR